MNPADQRFEDRLYKRINKLEKAMQDIKTAQPTGLDGLTYAFSDVVSASVFLNNGDDYNLQINYFSDIPTLYAGEMSLSFFINNDMDPAYHWPDGSALTTLSGLRPLDYYVHYDLFESDELGTGKKTYLLRVVNYGGIAKTVHLHAAMVFPKGNVS